jgi:hypothetical protein
VPGLDGFLWEATCTAGTASGKNCPVLDVSPCAPGTSWANRGTIRTRTFTVNGVAGTRYTITIDVRGVVGTRCYSGGAPASTAVPSPIGPNNTWYAGGTQANDSIWLTREIHVDPPVSGAANVYYANAFPASPNWCMREATYEARYQANFPVLGGGTIQFVLHDSNCQTQQNCGSDDAATTCTAPRTVDLSGASPPATFAQPLVNQVGANTYYPDWLYIDVISVTTP